MSKPECIITGCAFCDPNQVRWIWGDLFQLGSVLVLHASTTAQWNHGVIDGSERAVMHPNFLLRNNVVVFEIDGAQFNQTARQYLQKNIIPTEPVYEEPSRIITQ